MTKTHHDACATQNSHRLWTNSCTQALPLTGNNLASVPTLFGYCQHKDTLHKHISTCTDTHLQVPLKNANLGNS